MNRRRFLMALAAAGIIPWRFVMSDQFPVLADTGGDFVTKDELAQALANYLALDGGFMRGPIDMGGQRVAEGIFSTASTGERFEMIREDRNRLYMYTGEDAEVAPGRIVFDFVSDKPRVDVESPSFIPGSGTRGITQIELQGAKADSSHHGEWAIYTDFSQDTAALISGVGNGTDGAVAITAKGGASTVDLNTDNGNLELADNGDVTGTHGSYHVASDRALKENIEPIDDALEKVNQLEGVTYRFIDGDGRVMMGLIYQDVEPVVPEVAVKTGEYGAVEYPHLVPLLIEAIKTLTARVEQLEA